MTAKLVRDGRVAVLVSRGWGAGWSTWIGETWALYDPVIVQMLELDLPNTAEQIVAYCRAAYGNEHYYGGVDGLHIVWVTEGQRFYIEENDGAERLVLETSMRWETA